MLILANKKVVKFTLYFFSLKTKDRNDMKGISFHVSYSMYRYIFYITPYTRLKKTSWQSEIT